MIQQVLPLSKNFFSPYALKFCLQQRLAIALILLPPFFPSLPLIYSSIRLTMFISPSTIVEEFILLAFIVELELVFVEIFEEPGVAGLTWTAGLALSICSSTIFSSSASLHRFFAVLGPFIYSP